MASPLLARLAALAGSGRPAIEDGRGTTSFAALLDRAARAVRTLSSDGPLRGRSVALLASQDADWVASYLGILFSGGVAVPLSPAYPPAELAWLSADAGAEVAIVSDEHAALAAALAAGRRVLRPAELWDGPPAPLHPAAAGPRDTAALLYTSGTTGKPKGAMITHANLAVQTELLRRAWAISPEDRLLHALPLHHLHGLVVSLLTILTSGATTRMLPRFSAAQVTAEFERGDITVWMAVPTMYQKLRDDAERDPAARTALAAGARRLRLSTSGSAALPVSLADFWRELSGAIPLERYGMTEIGVALANPLDPEGRRPGWVGTPLPTMEIRLVDENGVDSERGPAELWVRGPSVFPGYFGRPDASRAAFAPGGWFRTGDIAERAPDGFVRLLGRSSVDILKSGGYKLSAVEIEEVFREHPAVAEVAVVGLPDETWGERVVAAVVLRAGARDRGETLRSWAKERLASYKVPKEVVVLPELPKNALGKVVKPELARRLGADAPPGAARTAR